MSIPGKQYPTLKGIFSAPKETHRRDFLRENKISLRGLEKETTKKLAAKEPVRPKWMPQPVALPSPLASQPPNQSGMRRSASMVRSEQEQVSNTGATARRKGFAKRGNSQTRDRAPDTESRNGICDTQSIANQSNSNKERNSKFNSGAGRCQSCGTERHTGGAGMGTVRDRSMQTDDIDDEAYLTEALRRLSGSRSRTHIDNAAETRSHISLCDSRCDMPSRKKSSLDIHNDLAQDERNLEDDDYLALNDIAAQDDTESLHSRYTIRTTASHHSNKQKSRQEHNSGNLPDAYDYENKQRARNHSPSSRSVISVKSTQRGSKQGEFDAYGHNQKKSSHNLAAASHHRYQDTGDDDDDVGYDPEGDSVSRQLKMLDLDDASMKNGYRDAGDYDDHCPNEDADGQLSARSRQTVISNMTTATTKSKRQPHKLGSREEVRLPRYLEREKRQKEEEKKRQVDRDPDCPPGFMLLSEQQRLEGLATAKNRFDTLIGELNRMPMTTQTLRVRNRRAEIDKELTRAEEDMRIFSKPKVFVKCAI